MMNNTQLFAGTMYYALQCYRESESMKSKLGDVTAKIVGQKGRCVFDYDENSDCFGEDGNVVTLN